MSRAIRYVLAVLPILLAALPPLALLRLWQARRMSAMGIHTTALHEIGLMLFLGFLIGLASLTILPPWELLGGFRLPRNWQSEISLIPLRVFWLSYTEHLRTGNWEYLFINLFGNILIFMPMGFFPPFLWKRWDSWQGAACWGLFASLMIEICQLPLDRCTDIDDLWTNLLGALLGYGLYRLLQRTAPSFVKKGRVRV